MKKFYFLSAVALSTTFFSAQILDSDNFNALNNGDVGTSTTFGSPGQGGIYTNGGANADYQIVSIDAGHGKSFQMASGNTGVATASNRQAVKPGLSAAWNARTSGNNIIQEKFEIYTGTAVGSTRIGTNITSTTAGIVGIHYNSETKTLNGQANITPTGGASGFYNITGITPNTYPANTWISVAFTYDSVNGIITYTVDGVKTTLNIAGYAVTKNLAPNQHNIVNQVISTNTAVNTGSIDNYVISAENTASLATGQAVTNNAKISLYPNPTADYLNFSAKVKSAQIFDAAGRNVSSSKATNNQIDVRNLAKGVYVVKFETENGTQTEKFIKQ